MMSDFRNSGAFCNLSSSLLCSSMRECCFRTYARSNMKKKCLAVFNCCSYNEASSSLLVTSILNSASTTDIQKSTLEHLHPCKAKLAFESLLWRIFAPRRPWNFSDLLEVPLLVCGKPRVAFLWSIAIGSLRLVQSFSSSSSRCFSSAVLACSATQPRNHPKALLCWKCYQRQTVTSRL